MNDLTKKSLIEVLEESDKFACDALSAYIHKADMLDSGVGRFKGQQSFMDTVYLHQSKLRIVVQRLKEEKI